MIDAFHRRLHARLTEIIAQRQESILQGVSSNTVEELALRYARDGSYLQALRDVIHVAQGIEGELYGDQAKKVLEG